MPWWKFVFPKTFLMMPKNRAARILLIFLWSSVTFCGWEIEKIFFTKIVHFLLLLKKIKISATLHPPNRRYGAIFNWGAPKTEFFSVSSYCEAMRESPTTPLKSATLWGSCYLKSTKVVFVADNCWFYQNVKKIGATNENWVPQSAGGRNFDRNFCQGAPDQYVANL